ncbi:MAG: CheF family chemotaxis protein [Salinirussus sp.]
MSDDERKLADQTGRFAQVVRDGRKAADVEWIAGRILLSNRRIVLASDEGKRAIPLSELTGITSRQDAANPLAKVSSYISLRTGDDVTLVSPAEHDAFEHRLYTAVLDQQAVLARHPAVEGGVVKDTDWEKGRLTVEEGDVGLALASGQFVEVDIDDVGSVATQETEIRGESRPVVEVEHTDEGTAVRTDVAGPGRRLGLLAGLLRKGEEKNTTDVELSEAESEVLMALYSGVSPFRVPDFVGIEVDEAEAIYDQLVDQGILERRRVRRDVSLKARGRHIASEASGEE